MPLTRTVKNNNRSNYSTLLVHFLAIDLQDYNLKCPETSRFSHFMEEMWYMFLLNVFSPAVKFISVW